MNAVDLNTALNAYEATWLSLPEFLTPFETDTLARMRDFLASVPQAFHRTHQAGHFTGSAFVVNESLTRTLLTHHRKLNLWLQLGGHADGDPLLHEVALRETNEETGLTRVKPFDFSKIFLGQAGRGVFPFDLDIHPIPARKNEPAHLHYDVRYLVIADENESLQISDESHDLRWLEINREAYDLAGQESMYRPFRKISWLRSR